MFGFGRSGGLSSEEKLKMRSLEDKSDRALARGNVERSMQLGARAHGIELRADRRRERRERGLW